MREIKFKTYNKETLVDEHATLKLLADGTGFDAPYDEYFWCESIDKKDKNNREIHEDDLIIYADDKELLFKVDMSKLGFLDPITDEASDLDIPPDRLLERASSFEIIGNVYHNPELLS